MSRVRYVKSLRDLDRIVRAGEERIELSVRAIRCVYETDAEVAQALVPRPLEATTDSRIHVSVGIVQVPLSPALVLEIGTACVAVAVHYQGREDGREAGREAVYPISMPTTHEAAVCSGRERFGEPRKRARIDFASEPDSLRVAARIERRGIAFLLVRGECVEEIGARDQIDEAYCFKAFPGCDARKGFDQDPLLLRVESRQRFERVARLEGDLELIDSPFDPVADLPLRRMVRFEYTEGTCHKVGRVLRPVPGEWLHPFIHQRADDPETEGLEV